MDKVLYYKNDFAVRLDFRNQDGDTIGVPGCDWSADFWTTRRFERFKAGMYGGTNHRCKVADNKVIIALDRHRLSPGELNMEVMLNIPDANFADGYQSVSVKVPTDIELTLDGLTFPATAETPIDIVVMLPVMSIAARPAPETPGDNNNGNNPGGEEPDTPDDYVTEEDLDNLFGDVFG